MLLTLKQGEKDVDKLKLKHRPKTFLDVKILFYDKLIVLKKIQSKPQVTNVC